MLKNSLLRLSCLLLLLTGMSTASYAVAESEPNDTWNQADAITLGATGTGTAGVSQNQDWWRVTSTEDGKLTVNWTATNSLYVYCQVYDTLGSLQFASNYTNGSSVINVDGLTAGTYYIKFFAYFSNEAPNYSFVATFTTPLQANDVEQNGTRALAKTLPLNGSKTGHIGYYYNNLDDTLDWYKVTTNLDGKLNFTITSHNGQNVYAELFDNNGTTNFGGNYTTTTATYSADGLSAGTYYIRIRTYYNSEFAPYTISNTLTLPPVANDIEPNGTYQQALTINLDDTIKGHIGYYYNFLDDTLDWYKVTTTLDGKINFYMQSLNGQNVYLNLYDGNGALLLGGNYTSSAGTWEVDGLAAGTYYFRVRTYYNYEFAPYKFIVKLITPSQTIDVEPNGTVAQAKNIGLNDSISGHIGYYYNNLRDTFDYRKIVLTQYGNLTWTARSTNGQNVYAQLYDNNGTSYLAGGYTSSTGTWSRNDLAPGTYYLRMNCYYLNSEFVPYSVKTTFTPVVATDVEPNASLATATAVPLNTNFYGCFGYYYNGARDTNDWLKVTVPDDGKIVFTATNGFANTSNIYLEVYDATGVNYFNQYTGGGSVLTYTKPNIRKGIYYIRVRGYYTSEYSQYLLNLTFTSTNGTDAESNNTAATSKMIAGYTTRSGNIGYNGFGTNTDTVDWHKIGTWGVGPVNLTFQKVANPDGGKPSINYKFYSDPNGAPLYNFDLVNDTTAVSYTLAAGVYYIKLTQLTNTYGGYKIVADYRDTCSLQLAVTTVLPDSGCGKGSIVYDITRGVPPYAVQLYKDGVAFGPAVATNGTAAFTLLDGGVYYASAKSTQAVECSKESGLRAIAGTPLNVQKLTINPTNAIIRWSSMPCADGFIVANRLSTAQVFTFDTVPAGQYRDTINGLSPGLKYRFKVASYVTYNGQIYVGDYSALQSIFTPLRASESFNEISSLLVYPNPATTNLFVNLPADKGVITITNVMGQLVKTTSAETLNGGAINIADLNNGIYIIKFETGKEVFVSRFIKE